MTAQYRYERLGQKVYIIDPYHVVDTENRACFNPLGFLDAESRTFGDDIEAIGNVYT